MFNFKNIDFFFKHEQRRNVKHQPDSINKDIKINQNLRIYQNRVDLINCEALMMVFIDFIFFSDSYVI